MSTKRLSKTVIEGGRYNGNKYDRRQSHTYVRAEERDYLKAVMADLEHAEEHEIGHIQPVYQGFRDKLSPMYRWIEAQVGRVWSEVRSEIFQKFDTRTTAGRHITFDHLLKEIVDTESGFDNHGMMANPNIPVIPADKKHYWYGVSDYYVDQDGILQVRPERRQRRFRSQLEAVPTEQEYKDAELWLQNRMVIKLDGKLYWAAPTEDIWMATWFEPHKAYDRWTPHQLFYYVQKSGGHEETHYRPDIFYKDKYVSYTIKTSGVYWEKVENPYSFRQRGELSQEEVKVFRSFKSRIRKDMIAYSKGR